MIEESDEKKYTININGLCISGSAENLHELADVFSSNRLTTENIAKASLVNFFFSNRYRRTF